RRVPGAAASCSWSRIQLQVGAGLLPGSAPTGKSASTGSRMPALPGTIPTVYGIRALPGGPDDGGIPARSSGQGLERPLDLSPISGERAEGEVAPAVRAR